MKPDKVADQVEILLVEDNIIDIEVTKEAFKNSKLRGNLKVVRDGERAIDYLRKKVPYENAGTPDLILLDLNLPKFDGRDVLEVIKNDPELKRIPVVVLTVSEDEVDIYNAYDLHANCYISKPVDFDKFEEIVRRIETFWFSVVSLPNKI